MPLETQLSNIIDNDTEAREQIASESSQPAPPPMETPEQKLQKEIADAEDKMLNDFGVAKIYLNDLTSRWLSVEQTTEANRLARDIDIDVDALRESGEIDDDECFIPERIIDSNIQREMPSYINFLKNSRRIAIFKDRVDSTFDTQLLEDAFTEGMTYKGWTRPFFKCIDGSMTHGWCSVEVVFDPSKPLQCSVEYVAHEDLIFPCDAKDIQNCSCVLRRYKVTSMQLMNWVSKFGFDLIQVNLIIEKYKERSRKDDTITIYKRFCKYNGTVYTSWFSLFGSCTDWLLKPKKHYAGIDSLQDVPVTTMQPIPQMDAMGNVVNIVQQEVQSTEKQWVAQDLSNYPVFILPYKETEKPLIFDYLGRVFYDKDKQEAQTAIVTSFVNGINRAQKIYASPTQDTLMDGKPAKQLANIKWANGTIFDKPMLFWNMPYPDFQILKALDHFRDTNSQDIGQTDYATVNRQDSRKTATEINASQQQSGLLDSVDLTLFSEFCRDVFAFCWVIVRSRALQNQIKFLQVDPTQAQGANLQAPQSTQQPAQMGAGIPSANLPLPNGQPVTPPADPSIQSIVNAMGSYQQEQSAYVNNYDTIVRDYDVRAAGDVDVVQKQEMVQKMQSSWPVYQQTALASRFLADLTKLLFPEDGAIYAQILIAGNPKNNVIQSLSTIIHAMIALPEVQQHLTPEMKQQLVQVQGETQQALAAP